MPLIKELSLSPAGKDGSLLSKEVFVFVIYSEPIDIEHGHDGPFKYDQNEALK